MKTSQPVSRLSLTALLTVAAGLLTGALWSSQPASIASASVQRQNALIDPTIPSIIITAKRPGKAGSPRLAREAIDPAVPHLTVIGYRDRTVAAIARSH